MNTERVAVALVGPTASGKSALAHSLAFDHHDSVEILCVDAMTVYRGMDIGTAKPTRAERAAVSYHLIDLVEPSEEFTVAQFQAAARAAAADVWRAGHKVLYVGGTGLYGRAVLDDLAIPAQYPHVRAILEARAHDELAALYAELALLDPLAASRMEPTNARRVVRALEVTLGAGRPFSSYGEGLVTYGPARVVQVALQTDFEKLDVRIATRFRTWMDQGLLEEVTALASAPGGMSRTARQAVGYRELLRHVEEGADLEACVEDAIIQSRRLARRQRSWFLRDPRIEWFDDPARARARLLDVLNGPDGHVRD
ncbi:MAG: tRNA (adenosine(37)-N6)-dimethylallyltransferase MiaA [Acidimicrobiales bacterium]